MKRGQVNAPYTHGNAILDMWSGQFPKMEMKDINSRNLKEKELSPAELLSRWAQQGLWSEAN